MIAPSQLLARLPQARWVQPDAGDNPAIRDAWTSDLLSDVMAHAPADSVLITLQAHANTVAVASLVGIPVIVICGDRPVPEDTLAVARRERIGILVTAASQFEASWRLHALLQSLPPP